MEIRFTQDVLNRLERAGYIGEPCENAAEDLKIRIAAFLRAFPGENVAIIQWGDWGAVTLRFVLNIYYGNSIQVSDFEVFDSDPDT